MPQSVFVVRGVAFSEDQQKKADDIQKKYTPELSELQRELNSVYTAEQRKAFQAALRAARDAGKDGRDSRQAAEDAARLSDEQKEQLSAILAERTELVARIQQELRALLTDEQRVQLARNQRGIGNGRRIAPTYPNVKYGPHERNIMDVWLARSDKPTPVLVSIHGGGFRAGNKSVEPGLLKECLDSGISVAAITYRLSDVAIAPAQFHDAARAIQFIRHNAKQWNLDAERMAATGGSAGAGLSLWLGFHDDLADPNSEDPVLRQSTRLTCMAVYNGQTSYDPRVIRDLFPGTDTYRHPALPQLYGVDFDELDNLPNEKYRLFEEVSALPHLSKDDVPALLMYASDMDTKITSQGIGIHHPRFGKVLKEKMDQLGIECRVETGVRRGDDSFTKLTTAFIRKHLVSSPVVDENVTYRKVDDIELQLDIARPAGDGPFPAMVFIHGGGWYQGDRHGYRSHIEEAAKRGFRRTKVLRQVADRRG